MAERKVAGESGGSGGGWGLTLALGAAAGAAVALAVWYFGFRTGGPEPAPLSAPEATVPGAAAPAPPPAPLPPATTEIVAPEAATTTTVAPSAEAPAAPAAVEPVRPSFDTVRVDADGATLVAGRAGEGAQVSILVDGTEVEAVTADAGGSFAALFTLAPSDRPRVMRLGSVLADGTRLVSEAEVIIAPFALPLAVAEAPAATVPAATVPAATAASAPPPAVAPPAAEGPAVLVIDKEGVRKETPEAPVAGIVIDTIGYGATGTVEIAGRGAAGALARLYLDNAERATVTIGAGGGWQASLADVAPGVYTLRVDQIDGAGKVASRFETPFQREAPETVTAALGAPDSASRPAAVTPAEPAAGVVLPETQAPGVAVETAPDVAPAADAAASAAISAAAPAAATPATSAAIVTVQPGFSLWRIARENYGEGVLYVKVFEANRDQIRDPDLIYPGQIFTVPLQE